MLLLAPARIADGLRDGTLPERSRFHLILLGTVLGALVSRRPVTAFRTYGEWFLAVLFLAVTALGLWSCYRANGGQNGRSFVERYVCLAVPTGIRVYAVYYLLYYCTFFVFRAGSGMVAHSFFASPWWPAATALVAMLVYYRVLQGYIRRSAGLGG